MEMGPVKRVNLGLGTDLIDVLEEVRRDKEPRLIERNGEELAIVVSVEGYRKALPEAEGEGPARDVMAFAGIWSDVDADRLIEEVYRARREAPPSPPVQM
jgi:hypothetical protein